MCCFFFGCCRSLLFGLPSSRSLSRSRFSFISALACGGLPFHTPRHFACFLFLPGLLYKRPLAHTLTPSRAISVTRAFACVARICAIKRARGLRCCCSCLACAIFCVPSFRLNTFGFACLFVFVLVLHTTGPAQAVGFFSEEKLQRLTLRESCSLECSLSCVLLLHERSYAVCSLHLRYTHTHTHTYANAGTAHSVQLHVCWRVSVCVSIGALDGRVGWMVSEKEGRGPGGETR